jgi:hypothetical protein
MTWHLMLSFWVVTAGPCFITCYSLLRSFHLFMHTEESQMSQTSGLLPVPVSAVVEWLTLLRHASLPNIQLKWPDISISNSSIFSHLTNIQLSAVSTLNHKPELLVYWFYCLKGIQCSGRNSCLFGMMEPLTLRSLLHFQMLPVTKFSTWCSLFSLDMVKTLWQTLSASLGRAVHPHEFSLDTFWSYPACSHNENNISFSAVLLIKLAYITKIAISVLNN